MKAAEQNLYNALAALLDQRGFAGKYSVSPDTQSEMADKKEINLDLHLHSPYLTGHSMDGISEVIKQHSCIYTITFDETGIVIMIFK